MFPTIAEYNQVIQKQGGKAFSTLSNLSFIPSRTIPVKIFSYGSGSYAVVFKAKDNHYEYAIRCFISAEQENIDRYRDIDDYLKTVNESWITKLELLENEINVAGQFYPIIKMDWVQGKLLNNYISQILHDNSSLTELQKEVVKVSRSLEKNKVGHGDIQCGNIIISKSEQGKNIIKLIDYDGMYIPAFTNKVNLERGRTEFQHPNRHLSEYNEKIDRFSFWVIICALEGLKFDKNLWLEVMQGGFNTLDNLLFSGEDFRNFNNSKLVNRLYSLNQASLSFYLNKLNNFCNSFPNQVEAPKLYNSKIELPEEVNLYEEELNIQSKSEDNGIYNEIEIVSNPIGAAVLNSSLQRIGTTPVKIDKAKYLDKTIFVSYGTIIKKIDVLAQNNVIDVTFPVNKPGEIPKPIVPIKDSTQSTGNIDSKSNPVSGWAIAAFTLLGAVFLMLIIGVISSSNEGSSTDSETVIGTETSIDDNGYTAETALNSFFQALDGSNCEEAWNFTLNDSWEENGKAWFCSERAFGGVTKATIELTHEVSATDSEKIIYVHYYTEDKYNGNQCFKQNFTIQKITTEDAKERWFITKLTNIYDPYPCEWVE